MTRWESDGIITAEQSQAILGSYSATELAPTSYRSQGRLVTGLSIVGAVLVGLGIILFFAANWDGIPRWPKLAIILATIVGFHGLGYYLRYHRGYSRIGSAMVLVACIVYGAGVHLVGQVYNVEVKDPRLMLFWFIGVFPLVYVVRSQPIQFLGVALFLLAVGFRLPDWFAVVYQGEGVLGATLFLILGLMILAIGRIKEEIEVLRPYSEVFQLVGMITALAALFVLTFKDVFDSFEEGLYIQGDTEVGFRALIAAAGVLTIVRLREGQDVWDSDGYFFDNSDSGRVFLKGKITNQGRLDFGLGTYFIPEGSGHIIERSRDVKVRVAVSSGGTAVIDELLVDGQPFDSNRPPDPTPELPNKAPPPPPARVPPGEPERKP